MKKLLILRFSAMGDVMLLVPVVRSLVATYPDVEVKVVTRPKFASFFHSIDRVKVYEADVDHHYTGFFGVRRLFLSLLARANYEVVIDMHDHVRTMVLRNLFRLAGKRVIVFHKGRKEKKAFTRKHNKITQPLPHTVQRYAEALSRAGYPVTLVPGPYLLPSIEAVEKLNPWLAEKQLVKNEAWIGIAPFAMHASKIWPLKNYASLIEELIRQQNPRFFLFGGGEAEISFFNRLQEKFPDHCVVVAGQLKMPEEIALMHRLNLMICTDSSNMHLAALCGTPVLSIWGGTHPDVGFGPFAQSEENILQISREELRCRPCSVFGTKTCHRGDFACLTRMQVQDVISRAAVLLTQ
jgi:ADP-heptose:LPS heptosyltransferase